MAKKKKFYVVWHGNEPGIYETWKECEVQIKGVPGARYKSFESKAEAIAAYNGNAMDFVSQKKKGVSTRDVIAREKEVVIPSWSVDAACSGNPGLMEYQGVITKDGTQIFHMGPFPQGTNNIGEFLALVHALALLKREKLEQLPIYSDSRIAIGWIIKKKCNTKLKQTAQNKQLFQLINRAEKWLKENKVTTPILKWKTKVWGEIPADFGRK